MAKSQFRKGTNQQSKKGLIRTVVFKLGAGLKIALQTVLVSKKENKDETKKD
jgi:hypothetical protein